MENHDAIERRRERDREKSRRWRERNPEAAKAAQAAYREKNKEKRQAENRAYCAENKDRRNAQRRERYASDEDYRTIRLEVVKAARKAAPAKRRQYINTRMRTDPAFRLKHSIGVQMRDALGRAKGTRSWHKLVGYTADDLKAHLESQFEPWMSWENYGAEWHIDHIRPIASFDLTAPGQIEACWALSNLRPLHAVENMRKKDNVA